MDSAVKIRVAKRPTGERASVARDARPPSGRGDAPQRERNPWRTAFLILLAALIGFSSGWAYMNFGPSKLQFSVTDALSGNPVSDAIVSLYNHGDLAARCFTQEGDCSVSVTPGSYQGAIASSNYSSKQFAVQAQGAFNVYALTVTPSFPTVVQPGSMTSTADYIVFSDGTSDFAKNGTSGAVDFSGTNATTILQNAINARRCLGGTIHFSGNFTLPSGLTLYPEIALEGDGSLGAFVGTATSVLTIAKTYNGPVIHIIADTLCPSKVTFPIVRDMVIDGWGSGSPTGQDGILVDPANGDLKDIYVQNVGVFKVGGNGINSLVGDDGKLWVSDFYAEYAGLDGIRYSEASGFWRVTTAYLVVNSGNGINNVGSLQIVNAQLTSNGQNGTLNTGTLLMSSCVVRLNSQQGIYNTGLLEMSATTVESNTNNGIRSTGTLAIAGSTFDTNGLYAIDATSSSSAAISGSVFYSNGNSAGSNLGGAIQINSNTYGVSVTGNTFRNNGGTGNANILFPGKGTNQVTTIAGNTFVDTRGVVATKYFIYMNAVTVEATITGNSFLGQLSGNPAILIVNITSSVVISNNQGYNDVLGQITNPFRSYVVYRNNIGLAGNASAPLKSDTYTVYCLNLLVTSTGGTGVSITIKDASANVVASGLTTLTAQYLPIGYTITFGAFSGAPTVTVFGI